MQMASTACDFHPIPLTMAHRRWVIASDTASSNDMLHPARSLGLAPWRSSWMGSVSRSSTRYAFCHYGCQDAPHFTSLGSRRHHGFVNWKRDVEKEN